MSRFQEYEENRRKFEGDVQYEMWRRGGNPDHISEGRMLDAFENDREPEAFAVSECKRIRSHFNPPQIEEYQEEEDQ